MAKISYNINDYVSKKFNQLYVIGYDTADMFLCQCSCGKELHVHVSALRDNKIYSCGCKNKTNINKIIDLTNRHFGELKVLEYVGNKYWRCQCSCGKIISTLGKYLTNGTKTSCGCTKGDMDINLGSKIGNWEVIEKRPNYKYLCRCSCGKEQEVLKYRLLDGSSTSCGHLNHNFIDLTNKVFGEWQVVKYNNNGEWLCKCQKGHTKVIKGEYLRHGEATKCIDCKKWFSSLINKNNCINNRAPQENIKDAIKTELLAYIQKLVKSDIEIEHNYEYDGQLNYFDIYIPSKNIAIEIDSTQSKDTVIKNKHYHQQKTIECFKKNMHLIHVFEYEWKDKVTKEKIKNYIKLLLSKDTTIVYGRNTVVKEIDNSVASSFCNKYHLQNSVNSNISLGLLCNNELLGVMTIGFPRFNSNYEYEIHRMCFKENTTIVGGAEKLFKYFIEKYNPHSVLTYVDLSKFTGLSYLRLGFNKVHNDFVTEPNYCWVSLDDKQVVVPRYKTQKHMLVENGLGDESQTEVEIMESLHFAQVFDCGNLKLEWKSNEQ